MNGLIQYPKALDSWASLSIKIERDFGGESVTPYFLKSAEFHHVFS
jgi:hypothetical protein